MPSVSVRTPVLHSPMLFRPQRRGRFPGKRKKTVKNENAVVPVSGPESFFFIRIPVEKESRYTISVWGVLPKAFPGGGRSVVPPPFSVSDVGYHSGGVWTFRGIFPMAPPHCPRSDLIWRGLRCCFCERVLLLPSHFWKYSSSPFFSTSACWEQSRGVLP